MQSKKYIIILSVLLAAFLRSIGQDVAFSQFYANPLYLNPALAGAKLCPRLTLNFRNQWPSVQNGYVTYSATYDDHLESISGGIGLIANSTVAAGGAYNIFSGSGLYSYRLQASRSLVLNAAFKVGYTQYRLNWEKFVFGDQINVNTGVLKPTSELAPSRPNYGDLDLSAGFLAGYKESLYFGVAVDHLNKPEMSFYGNNTLRMDYRLTIHAGALFDFVQGMEGEDLRNFSLSPNVVFLQQGKFHQLNVGMSVNMYPLVAGLWYRNNIENSDAMIVLLGFQQKQFKVGYSFDYTISRFGVQSGGAHEFSLSYLFNAPKKNFHIRELKCPSF
jgi:type IX secretion system PorP/SprF family membrane protein